MTHTPIAYVDTVTPAAYCLSCYRKWYEESDPGLMTPIYSWQLDDLNNLSCDVCLVSLDPLDNEYTDSPACPACGDPAGRPMGTLGDLQHFKCRSCGIEYSQPAEDDETPDDAPAPGLLDIVNSGYTAQLTPIDSETYAWTPVLPDAPALHTPEKVTVHNPEDDAPANAASLETGNLKHYPYKKALDDARDNGATHIRINGNALTAWRPAPAYPAGYYGYKVYMIHDDDAYLNAPWILWTFRDLPEDAEPIPPAQPWKIGDPTTPQMKRDLDAEGEKYSNQPPETMPTPEQMVLFNLDS